jgi:uncharacterized protein (DUF433 family)
MTRRPRAIVPLPTPTVRALLERHPDGLTQEELAECYRVSRQAIHHAERAAVRRLWQRPRGPRPC